MKKQDSIYKLRKRLDYLKEENARLSHKLYCYRQTVQEISTQLHEWIEKDYTKCNMGYILRKIRERCML